jgi:hypothetical protein
MNAPTGQSNFAHTLAAWLGVAVAAQAPIVAYVATLPIPVKAADLGAGAFGLFCTMWKMNRDSQHNQAVTVATITAAAAPAPVAQATIDALAAIAAAAAPAPAAPVVAAPADPPPAVPIA